ncbi:MAG: peptidase T [Planctomycetota bacterium]|nr:MAG: peptidase T [Planctomycetota bacterium]REK28217.1 MAG: peptidase T [Planctomycetota bacterium]REK39788.1 MAG: peptidase T [Planctomycetota bacterium]
MTINQDRLLERLLRYVQIDTTAREEVDDYPSSAGQFELGRLVAEELRAAGAVDVEQSKFGIVTATLPASGERTAPVVALCAHFDTSPETSGKGCRPQVLRDYDGQDIQLPGDDGRVVRVAECPELAEMVGRTLVTTDGTTLLGGDDKAGVAVIVETIAHLAENQDIDHGTVRVCLTCDEEVGRGTDHIDLAALGADVCYTLDGQGQGELDVETFSADLATVRIEGVNIHPAIAKGKMVNAVRIAGDFLSRLPAAGLSPETTDGRDGFMHPYTIEGGVAEVTLRILLRDFDTAKLAEYARILEETAHEVASSHAGSRIAVDVREQYRNMAAGLRDEPRAVGLAAEAYRRLGTEPKLTIVRGGTDGSKLTELGLPTPNLSTGQHNIHSPLEWACLEEMEFAVRHLVELLQLWAAEEKR